MIKSPCGGLNFSDDFMVENGVVALASVKALMSESDVVKVATKQIPYMPPSKAKSPDELEKYVNALVQSLIDSGLMASKWQY